MQQHGCQPLGRQQSAQFADTEQLDMAEQWCISVARTFSSSGAVLGLGG